MSLAERRPVARWPLLLAGVLLLAQAANFALVETAEIVQYQRLAGLERATGSPAAGSLSLAGYRALDALAPFIPEDDRVLLVVDSDTPVAWDFQLLPRPLHVLFEVDAAMEGRVARLDPALGERLMRWHAEIRQRDQQLTPEALRRHLAQAQWLLTVSTGGAPLELPEDGPRREFVARSGPVSLFRLVAP